MPIFILLGEASVLQQILAWGFLLTANCPILAQIVISRLDRSCSTTLSPNFHRNPSYVGWLAPFFIFWDHFESSAWNLFFRFQFRIFSRSPPITPHRQPHTSHKKNISISAMSVLLSSRAFNPAGLFSLNLPASRPRGESKESSFLPNSPLYLPPAPPPWHRDESVQGA